MKSFLGNFYWHLAIFSGHTATVEETKKGFNARAKAKAILMNANLSPSLELRKERKESLDTEIGEAFDFSSFFGRFRLFGFAQTCT